MTADNELRSMIRDTATRLMKDHMTSTVRQDADGGNFAGTIWRLLADSGFLTVEPGGLSYPDALALLEVAGYWGVPLPWAESLLVTKILTDQGLSAPGGVLTLGWQWESPATMARSAEHMTISGNCRCVPWARHADVVALLIPDGEDLWICLAPRDAFQVESCENLAGEAADSVRVEQSRVRDFALSPYSLRWIQAQGALMRVMAAVGAIDRILEMTVTYAKERTQFGRPLAKFQVVQEKLAEMAGESAALRAIAERSLAAAEDQLWDEVIKYVAVAKVRLPRAVRVVSTHAHQIHGAIGFTREYPLHYYTRRLWSYRHEYGSERHWALEMAREMADQDVWDFITGMPKTVGNS